MELKFNKHGLIPTIVQDSTSGKVLMMAYMNKESLDKTLETGQTYFWSRSRNELWHKGKTSGHFQNVVDIQYDCDEDCLLILVEQIGMACHTGTESCFFRSMKGETPMSPKGSVLDEIIKVVRERKQKPIEGSYTNYLFDKGIDKMLKKVGEEAAEVIIASKNEEKEFIAEEIGDLLYHLSVVLVERDMDWSEVFTVLGKRRK